MGAISFSLFGMFGMTHNKICQLQDTIPYGMLLREYHMP
jgi:hypothetical protein